VLLCIFIDDDLRVAAAVAADVVQEDGWVAAAVAADVVLQENHQELSGGGGMVAP
jgi:hypothetical protein